jgi:hypothetical protein
MTLHFTYKFLKVRILTWQCKESRKLASERREEYDGDCHSVTCGQIDGVVHRLVGTTFLTLSAEEHLAAKVTASSVRNSGNKPQSYRRQWQWSSQAIPDDTTPNIHWQWLSRVVCGLVSDCSRNCGSCSCWSELRVVSKCITKIAMCGIPLVEP